MFSGICLAGKSQGYKADAKLDTNAMLIGDHVGMTLRFTLPARDKVRWPVFDTILGNIQVIGRSKVDTAYSPDRQQVTLSQKVVITSYDSGFYSIPPIRFYYRQPPDTAEHFELGPTLLLAVHTVKVDTTLAIKPIKGIMKVPLTFRELLPWILGAILAAALVYFVIYFIRKRKKAEPLIRLKPRVQLQPHETALAALEKLRTKKLWQSGKIKEYHTELTDIIRVYIEGQFSAKAMESTSSEILEELSAHREIPAPSTEKLGRLLLTADLVKFAKATPVPDENEVCLDYAIEFVRNTIFRPEPEKSGKTEPATS